MRTFEYAIIDELGIHARPAGMLVKEVKKFDSKITLSAKGKAVIGIEIDKGWNGKTAAVDGYTGTVYVEPDEECLARMNQRMEEDETKKRLMQELKGKETMTRDGRKIHLYANIGNVADTMSALQNDAEGIGLFRSEFLYLESKDFPTEEEQFQAYKTVAESMAGKKVVIRTLDIGADKQVDYFNLEREENPAMGYRAIRICLDRPEIFRTQLRAILRASAFGNISIMFPMIISLAGISMAHGLASAESLEQILHLPERFWRWGWTNCQYRLPLSFR